MSDTLPISKQEIEIVLAGLKHLEMYYSDDGLWTHANRVRRIHNKLQINLSRYEKEE